MQQRRQRMNIRMSKLSRILQSNVANTNWAEMAKMLFCSDQDEGRQAVIGKMPAYRHRESGLEKSVQESATDQIQHLLVFLFILTIAEKRAQEVYQREFSERCDAISVAHGLDENEYWTLETVPVEWQQLDAEFEQRSVTILQDTLREYSMHEIADQIGIGGTAEFIELIRKQENQVSSLLQSH